jgi:putative ABC transport system substrate-binding protein
MRRRNFVALAGAAGLAVAWPYSARAQQKMARIGVLAVSSSAPLGPFRESLRELGYVEGRNVEFVQRSAEGHTARLPALAAELVRTKVDVIVTVFTPAATAAKNATSEIPIVMAPAGNPVGTGLVASLARPGGNVTGMSGTGTEMGTKNLELIRDAVPSAKRVAVLAHATDPFTKGLLEQMERGGRLLRMALGIHMIRGPGDLEAAFLRIKGEQAQAVFIQGSIPTKPTVDLALTHRLPALAQQSAVVRAGALMSYSASNAERGRVVAAYVDKILKGAKPADLPVQQPTRYELVINLKTAKAIGLTIPPALIARADEVIE